MNKIFIMSRAKIICTVQCYVNKKYGWLLQFSFFFKMVSPQKIAELFKFKYWTPFYLLTMV